LPRLDDAEASDVVAAPRIRPHGVRNATRPNTRAGSWGIARREAHAGDYNDEMTDDSERPGGPDISVTLHPRSYRGSTYVYPVLSRRARGISIGINLNPDKVCNFDCIYCQVDRTTEPTLRRVDEEVLRREL